MLATYKAVIQDDRVQWRDAHPPMSTDATPLEVLVTVLNEGSGPEGRRARGRKMADALRQIARGNPLAEIADPAQWERELRQDRPLPGREP